MSNGRTSVAEKQVPAAQENPIVRIEYSPENALALLATNTTKMLGRLQGAKITSLKTLESASELIHEAQITSDEVEHFIESLREKIQNAAGRFREFSGFQDFEITLTVRKWGLRQLLGDSMARLKRERANYLAEEAEKTRREQLAKQAEQDRINREAAEKAAKEAKKQGADKQTVAAIKEEVLSTPAPVVVSKAADVAQSVGASVRYSYSAQITDLKKFLGLCLNNPTMFATLGAAIPDIEKAFRTMAASQKESFDYPGIRFKRTAVDVGRRSA